MKKYDRYLSRIRNLIYGTKIIKFEDRTILVTTLSVSLLLGIASIANVLLELQPSLIFISIIGSIFFSVVYIYGRMVAFGSFYYWMVSMFFLIYIDLIWFYNYGSQGPLMAFLVIFCAFLILVFEKKYYLPLSAVLILNLIGLYVIEYNFSAEIGHYADHIMRLDDNYIGTFFGFILMSFFLTGLKKNYILEFERAKRSDLLKSAFLANMSHEIRTPLNAIVGFSSLVFDPDLKDQDKELYVDQIQKNSDYLLSLIDDIIDVSKIESNQLALKMEETDVVPLVGHLVQSFQLAIVQDKSVQVESTIRDPKLVVYVDRIRLEQILRNLLSNAVKFTEKGSIEVNCIKEKDFYIFSVKDSGIGISAENLGIIFDRFIKIENQWQHLHRGTGIGLFLSKQLVQLFGGKIWVKSVVGEGSTFYFTIPA